MNKISKNDYKNFISWAKENTANTVYPCSIAEGFQSGDIYVNDGKVCAVAFSAAVSLDEIDIGVETHEDYRRNGLAALLTNKMCEHIIEIGKKPVWAHATSNTGSMNTALKCGFVLGKTNTVIKRKD